MSELGRYTRSIDVLHTAHESNESCHCLHFNKVIIKLEDQGSQQTNYNGATPINVPNLMQTAADNLPLPS